MEAGRISALIFANVPVGPPFLTFLQRQGGFYSGILPRWRLRQKVRNRRDQPGYFGGKRLMEMNFVSSLLGLDHFSGKH